MKTITGEVLDNSDNLIPVTITYEPSDHMLYTLICWFECRPNGIADMSSKDMESAVRDIIQTEENYPLEWA